MRNFLWLLGVLGCIAAAARFQPNAPYGSVRSDVSVSWQEWDERGPTFTFCADGSGVHSRQTTGETEAKVLGLVKEDVPGSKAAALHARLRKEVEVALEEPCRGGKTRELTLREGSRTWTIEIGTYAGPAQAHIIEIMEGELGELRGAKF
ncbi:hypothetical protein ABS71_08745 [bacterium SCN 62-11]|nr:hypothetical protein [Candidatus Eremiobacteraeota bacterium]ODT69985.1 MAG: hypothetical protein ABS71_08745 [bacterium SCN 62-11]